MNGVPRRTVFVSPVGARAVRPRLLAALEEAFPVRFEDWTPGSADGAGLIAIGPPGELPDTAELPGHLPTLALSGRPAAPTRTAAPETFTLGLGSAVDRRVRGIGLADYFFAPPFDDVGNGRANVLATTGSDPVWTVLSHPAPLHRLRSTLPELESGEVLYALLSKHQLTAVALVQFLRDVCAPGDWKPAPLRAVFLFDDPNLRWRSYGFIDYSRLADHAEEHGYHAAMAMIPLDAGRPHAPTVDLFHRRADRLSLIVHGNDHTRGELLATGNDDAARTIAAQAVRRIQRFERRSGLAVDRVMAPPHGLCSQPMTRALGAVGFDALTAIHPLPWTATPPSGPLLAGWRAADFVAGCPVVPRIPLSSSAADIALRAFLDHPLVVYGHHEDLAGGLDALAQTADIVNGVGDVRWTSVGDIVTSNSERRLNADQLTVRPLSRRVVVAVDPDVRTVVVDAPQDSLDRSALNGFAIRDLGDPIDTGQIMPFDREVTLRPGSARRLQITLHGNADVEPGPVPPPPWRPWPKLRRVVTEIRDRAIAQTGPRSAASAKPTITGEDSHRWAA
jgi:hypothetical protein